MAAREVAHHVGTRGLARGMAEGLGVARAEVGQAEGLEAVLQIGPGRCIARAAHPASSQRRGGEVGQIVQQRLHGKSWKTGGEVLGWDGRRRGRGVGSAAAARGQKQKGGQEQWAENPAERLSWRVHLLILWKGQGPGFRPLGARSARIRAWPVRDLGTG